MARRKTDYAKLYTLRPDGRYQGYYRDKQGKRHTVCDRDPEALFYKIQDKEDERDKPITFREIAEAWYRDTWPKIEDGTQSSYQSPYNKAVERFGDRVASEITPRDILNHLEYLKRQGLSRSTVKTQKAVYSLIYGAAVLNPDFEQEIKVNPADNVKMPTGFPKPQERHSPEDDVVKLIQERCQDAYFGMFAMFLICTGFRRGEALAIKWGDVDFENDTISCTKQIGTHGGVAYEKDPKTENGIRVVPILPPLKAALQRPEGALDRDYIFYGSEPSKPMPTCTYERRWKHYCKDMGFVEDSPEQRISAQGKRYIKHNYKPTLTAHHLRHGYVTILFEAGVDEYTAMRLAGHANIDTTRAIYTHLRNKKKDESVGRLREYVKNGL